MHIYITVDTGALFYYIRGKHLANLGCLYTTLVDNLITNKYNTEKNN